MSLSEEHVVRLGGRVGSRGAMHSAGQVMHHFDWRGHERRSASVVHGRGKVMHVKNMIIVPVVVVVVVVIVTAGGAVFIESSRATFRKTTMIHIRVVAVAHEGIDYELLLIALKIRRRASSTTTTTVSALFVFYLVEFVQ